MRVVMLISLPLIPAAILFPLMPSDTLALTVLERDRAHRPQVQWFSQQKD